MKKKEMKKRIISLSSLLGENSGIVRFNNEYPVYFSYFVNYKGNVTFWNFGGLEVEPSNKVDDYEIIFRTHSLHKAIDEIKRLTAKEQ